MLYLIGLGLYDEGDISLKGLEVVKGCEKVYAELYTSPWQGSLEKLGERFGKRIVALQRSDLEEGSDGVIDEAKEGDVAVLVPGDPLVATTHTSLLAEARKKGVGTRVIHSSSVFSAIAETGLHIYKFGRTATVAYPEKNFFPKTPYNVLTENLKNGAHTLLLLDVKADKGRYMSISEAIGILLELERQENKKGFTKETKCVGVARLGGETTIRYGTAEELSSKNFGKPPHVLVVPGEMHFSEEECLAGYSQSR